MINWNLLFKNKIAEDVYHFDILARKDGDFYPQLVGTIVVNLKKQTASITFNVGITVLNKEKIYNDAVKLAEQIETVIGI